MKTYNRFASILFAIFSLFILYGCALTPKDPQALLQSDLLLTQQLDKIEKYLQQTSPPTRTVIYVGSAQHSQSLVFQSDVLLTEQKLKEINPNLQSIILSNQSETSRLVYPFATQSSLNRIFQKVDQWSQKNSVILFFLVSTHGNVNVLSVNIGNSYLPAVRPEHIKNWLAGLKDTPTALLLSACYSGSFIPTLSAQNRIILTAAAHDRNSFGCSYHEKNTYFIDGLLGDSSWNPDLTWQEMHNQAAEKISKLEQKNNLQASSPQINAPDILINQKIKDFASGVSPN